jgi:hypothetical protein
MSTRGAPMQITHINANSQSAFNSDPAIDGVKMVNLKQALEDIHANTTNGLPSITREATLKVESTLAKLIADPKECEATVHPSFWMRGVTLREDWHEIRDYADPIRSSFVESVLVQNVDMLGKVNISDVHVGTRYKGLRGRSYEVSAEHNRFLDIAVPYANDHFSPGERCIHQPSLNGLQITAASFSNITKDKLAAEYGPKAGAPGMSHLINSPYSRILASMQEFTQGLSETICSQYGIDPARIPCIEANEQTGEPGLFQFPTKYLEDQSEWILKSQENLSHFNPVINGHTFNVKFLPADCKNWAEFPKSKLYSLWEEQGPAYLKQKLDSVVTFSHQAMITFLPDDDITRNSIAVNLK